MLLLSSEALALEASPCKPSDYLYRGKALCFSSVHRTHLTGDCLSGKCQALEILRKAKDLREDSLSSDSRHLGSKRCEALGGLTALAESTSKNQLCVCELPDRSAIACTRLGL
jgi:hypothetical protein